MMKPTDKEIAKWAKIRGRGMWHFVLLKGALAWGLLVAASGLVATSLYSGFPKVWLVVACWLICSVAGALVGYEIWQRMEEAYLERQTKT